MRGPTDPDPPIYDLDSALPGAPSLEERRLVGTSIHVRDADLTVESTAGAKATSPLGWRGARDEVCEPIIAVRLSPIHIDTRIRTSIAWIDRGFESPTPEMPSVDEPVILHGSALTDALGQIGLDEAIRLLPAPSANRVPVAVIDYDYSRFDALSAGDRLAPIAFVDAGQAAATKRATPAADAAQMQRVRALDPTHTAGHGTAMTMVYLAAPCTRVRAYQLGGHRAIGHAYAGATHFALAIDRACAEGAAVILLSYNQTALGSPRHLQRVLHEVARRGRGGRGTVIVWSSGDVSRTGRAAHHALQADDPSGQPWVLTVGASDRSRRWARRDGWPLSRLGPSIDLVAPGDPYLVEHGEVFRMADDSSLAAALVATAAAVVLGHNPWLTAGQVRELLCATARRPPHVDVSSDPKVPASWGGNDWDRAGHNFKLGHGEVDAHRAALAARDPLCAAFIFAGRPGPGRSPLADDVEPGLVLARRWHETVTAATRPIATSYRTWAPLFARAFLDDREVRRGGLWIARHLIELAVHPVEGWLDAKTDHGALVQRALIWLWDGVEAIVPVLAREHASAPESCPAPAALRAFAEELEREIVATDGATLSGLLHAVLAPAR